MSFLVELKNTEIKTLRTIINNLLILKIFDYKKLIYLKLFLTQKSFWANE